MNDYKNRNAVISAQALARSGPPSGSRWQHYKGDFYTVLACGVKESTLTPEVIYRSEALGFVWTRSLDEWRERVKWPDGSLGHRYRRTDDGALKSVPTYTEPYGDIHAFIDRIVPQLSAQDAALMGYLKRAVPFRRVIILEEDGPKWREAHTHADVEMGAIGGHITQRSTDTSIGTMTTLCCVVCKEEAWLDCDF